MKGKAPRSPAQGVRGPVGAMSVHKTPPTAGRQSGGAASSKPESDAYVLCSRENVASSESGSTGSLEAAHSSVWVIHWFTTSVWF